MINPIQSRVVFLLITLSLFLVIPASATVSPHFIGSCLTGGTDGCLDSIDGQDLWDGWLATIITASDVYFYSLDIDSGAAESSPNTISPDTNAGDKRWILRAQTGGTGTGDMLKSVYDSDGDNYIDINNGGFDDDFSSSTGIPVIISAAWTILNNSSDSIYFWDNTDSEPQMLTPDADDFSIASDTLSLVAQIPHTDVNETITGKWNFTTILSDSLTIKNAGDSETLATFVNNGAVALYYNNNDIVTTANEGPLFAEGGAGSGDLYWISNSTLVLRNLVNSGDIRLAAKDSGGSTQVILTGDPDGETGIYHDGSKKIDTDSDGATITGILHVDGISGKSVINVLDYDPPDQTCTSDCTTAFQAAIDAAEGNANPGILYVPAGCYKISGTLTFGTNNLTVQGSGYGTHPQTTNGGTWFYKPWDGSAEILFDVNESMIHFKDFAVDQEHDAAGGGWAPNAQGYVFDITGAYDDIHITNIYIKKAYDFVKLDGGGRLFINGLYGQALHRGITIDNSNDVNRINNVHLWTYWSTDSNVTDWMRSNFYGISLYEVDNSQFSNLFIQNANKAIYMGEGDSTPQAFEFNNVLIEFSKWGLFIDGTNLAGSAGSGTYAAKGMFTNTYFHGGDITNSIGIEIESAGNAALTAGILQLNTVRFDDYDLNCILAEMGDWQISVSNGWFEDWSGTGTNNAVYLANTVDLRVDGATIVDETLLASKGFIGRASGSGIQHDVTYNGDPTFDTLTVSSSYMVVATSHVPAAANDTCTTGQIAWDSTYFYICIATDTWQRVQHATW